MRTNCFDARREVSASGDFKRGVKRWGQAFAKMKAAAEEAKVEVSRSWEKKQIWIEALCADDGGSPVELDCALTPDEARDHSLSLM